MCHTSEIQPLLVSIDKQSSPDKICRPSKPSHQLRPIFIVGFFFITTLGLWSCSQKEASQPALNTLPAITTNSEESKEPAYTMLKIGPDTQARYRVREQLANLSFPNDAIGTTNAVRGHMLLGPGNLITPGSSSFVVDLTTLKSDESRRDKYIQQRTLQTDQFPNAEFLPEHITDLSWPIPTTGELIFFVTGKLKLHGITKTITWKIDATFTEGEVLGLATIDFDFAKFNLSQPKVARVLSVADRIRLELDLHLIRTDKESSP